MKTLFMEWNGEKEKKKHSYFEKYIYIYEKKLGKQIF